MLSIRALPVGILLVGVVLSGCGSASTTAVGPAAKIVFGVQPPISVAPGAPIAPPVHVALEDAQGNLVTSTSVTITVVLGANPGLATLSGTTAAATVGGFATFSNLSLNQLGTGYTLIASAPGFPADTSIAFNVAVPPVIVPLVFASVSAGESESCGVTTSGAAYCWGDNVFGQLGDSTTANSATPVAVFGGLTFASVSAGDYQTCGVAPSGAAYCWGNNANGQLGNGTYTNSSIPVPVSGGLTFASVSAGLTQTCGVTTSGAAYCWGDNTYGQLGNVATPGSATPVAVAGGLTFRSVSAGGNETCGVASSAAAYCWGDNYYGQLGNGIADTLLHVTPAAVSGGLTFGSVSTGYGQACGVTTSGAAYCWGFNGAGQLGHGGTDTLKHTVPVAVSGALTFASVSAGGNETCGLNPGGAAYCWGDNTFGELGNGTTTNSATPVAVTSGLTFASVSAGYGQICGVTSSGAAYCWGTNLFGQLGNGTTTGASAPVAVSGPVPIAGAWHALPHFSMRPMRARNADR